MAFINQLGVIPDSIQWRRADDRHTERKARKGLQQEQRAAFKRAKFERKISKLTEKLAKVKTKAAQVPTSIVPSTPLVYESLVSPVATQVYEIPKAQVSPVATQVYEIPKAQVSYVMRAQPQYTAPSTDQMPDNYYAELYNASWDDYSMPEYTREESVPEEAVEMLIDSSRDIGPQDYDQSEYDADDYENLQGLQEVNTQRKIQIDYKSLAITAVITAGIWYLIRRER